MLIQMRMKQFRRGAKGADAEPYRYKLINILLAYSGTLTYAYSTGKHTEHAIYYEDGVNSNEHTFNIMSSQYDAER